MSNEAEGCDRTEGTDEPVIRAVVPSGRSRYTPTGREPMTFARSRTAAHTAGMDSAPAQPTARADRPPTPRRPPVASPISCGRFVARAAPSVLPPARFQNSATRSEAGGAGVDEEQETGGDEQRHPE